MLVGRHVRFDGTVIPRIRELLGTPIPLFLQMLTQELYRLWKRDKSKTLTARAVEEVYAIFISRPRPMGPLISPAVF
jgi:hypothetical protein